MSKGKNLRLTLPELAMIAGTRAALGAGLAFLMADRLPRDRRIAVGWALLTIGALTSVPLALEVLGRPRLARELVADQSQEGSSGSAGRFMGRREHFVW